MTEFNQIQFTHYILDKMRALDWDVKMLGPCQNKEFMKKIDEIAAEIEEAHRLLGKVKE